jgi:hypothetical protein
VSRPVAVFGSTRNIRAVNIDRIDRIGRIDRKTDGNNPVHSVNPVDLQVIDVFGVDTTTVIQVEAS